MKVIITPTLTVDISTKFWVFYVRKVGEQDTSNLVSFEPTDKDKAETFAKEVRGHLIEGELIKSFNK
jgi:hypothetical protein